MNESSHSYELKSLISINLMIIFVCLLPQDQQMNKNSTKYTLVFLIK